MNKKKLIPYLENSAEATAACLLVMVQGNVLMLGLSHWLIASQTGIAAGVISATIFWFTNTQKRWAVSLLLGGITAIVDFLIHPGMAWSVAIEALITGAAAALLSFVVGGLVHAARRRRTA